MSPSEKQTLQLTLSNHRILCREELFNIGRRCGNKGFEGWVQELDNITFLELELLT